MKKSIYSYIFEDRVKFTFLIIYIAIISILDLSDSWLKMYLIDYVQKFNFDVIFKLGIFYILVLFSRIGFSYILGIFKNNYIENVKFKIFCDITKCISKQKIKKFKNEAVYLSWFTNDIKMIEDYSLSQMYQLLKEVFYLIFSIIFLVKINFIILFLVLLSSVFFWIVVKMFSPSIEEKTMFLSKANQGYFSKIKNLIDGMKYFYISNKEQNLLREFKEKSNEIKYSSISMQKSIMKAYMFLNLIAVISQIGIFILSGFFVYYDILTLGSLILISNVSGRLNNSICHIVTCYTSIKAGGEIYKKFEREIEIEEDKNINCEEINDIEYKNVSLKFGELEVISNFSYKFEKK